MKAERPHLLRWQLDLSILGIRICNFGTPANKAGNASLVRAHSSLRNRSSTLRSKTYAAKVLLTCATSALQAMNLHTLRRERTRLQYNRNHCARTCNSNMSSRSRFCRSVFLDDCSMNVRVSNHRASLVLVFTIFQEKFKRVS